jgi:hypothetical protein
MSNGTVNCPIEVSGIWLAREGEYIIVRAEVDGVWVEVIREHHDGPFSHIVEDNGIRAARAKLPYDMRRHWQELFRGMRTRDTQQILRKMPCGECHLADGETCDICGAYQMARESSI